MSETFKDAWNVNSDVAHSDEPLAGTDSSESGYLRGPLRATEELDPSSPNRLKKEGRSRNFQKVRWPLFDLVWFVWLGA